MTMESIKKIRKRLGLSAREFGLRCGLEGKNIARTVYRWENGKSMSKWCEFRLEELKKFIKEE